MPTRISHDLPRLATLQNRIVVAGSSTPVLLRGINLSGLEYCSPDEPGSLAKAHIDPDVLDEIAQNWNANIIRLPINQNWALQTPSYDPIRYVEAIEAVIKMAAERGAYTLVDLQWLDDRTPRGTTGGKTNYVPALPTLESISMWRQLAALWRDEPAVLFDVLNEPHNPLPNDDEPLLGIREDGTTFPLPSRQVRPCDWTSWARHLISAIRGEHSGSLAFVSGTEWGYDLRGCVLPDLENIVYSTHVYPSKGTKWDQAFGHVSASVPVFAAEWGGGDSDLDWGAKLAAYFHHLGVGWAAWSWSDEPRLTRYTPAEPYKPTAFGKLVRDLLQNPAT